MVQKTVIIYADDLTGVESTDVGTHSFALDDVNYEIDLTPESYDALFEALEPFIKAGRKSRRAKGRGANMRRAPGEASAEEIRVWAKENGHEVSPRGRVPALVKKAYEGAH
ncbi:histone-like nucleoid-structuring protein Lsr2 [Streptomyces sp. NPDC002285]